MSALPLVDLVGAATPIPTPWTAYAALNVFAQASGFTYNDPTTNVQVVKISSSTTPNSNSGCGSPYGDGGNYVSRSWQDGAGDWFKTIYVFQGGPDQSWLVDIKLTGSGGILGLSNWRQLTGQLAPQADLAFSFSYTQPRIAHVVNGTTLRRINTQTMTVANTGNFPYAVGFSNSPWLMHDMYDRKFSFASTANVCKVWDSQTNITITAAQNANEVRLSKSGNYALQTAPGRYWDLTTNVLTDVVTSHSLQHNATMIDRFAGQNWDLTTNAPYWKCGVSGAWTSSFTNAGFGINTNEAHGAGQWVQPTVPLDQQYFAIYGVGAGANWTDRGFGFVRLDGADARMIANHFNGDGSNDGGSYYSFTWCNPCPDGLIVLFNSCQLPTAGTSVSGRRWDLFAAIIPRIGGL